jgi:hypothetical protein
MSVAAFFKKLFICATENKKIENKKKAKFKKSDNKNNNEISNIVQIKKQKKRKIFVFQEFISDIYFLMQKVHYTTEPNYRYIVPKQFMEDILLLIDQ